MGLRTDGMIVVCNFWPAVALAFGVGTLAGAMLLSAFQAWRDGP
jgi:hypothetical protein